MDPMLIIPTDRKRLHPLRLVFFIALAALVLLQLIGQ
jgi:hypothetical protein